MSGRGGDGDGTDSSRHSHHVFETKSEALRWLDEHGMDSVGWPERGKHKEACYWNGQVYVTEKK